MWSVGIVGNSPLSAMCSVVECVGNYVVLYNLAHHRGFECRVEREGFCGTIRGLLIN